jgi:hypothetical protein
MYILYSTYSYLQLKSDLNKTSIDEAVASDIYNNNTVQITICLQERIISADSNTSAHCSSDSA